MGRVYLCLGQYAKIPYSFDAARVRVFCMEELCYFLKENAYLLDESMFSIELAEWVGSQCGLKELEQRLRLMIKNKEKPESFVKLILEFTGYYDPVKIRETQRMVSASADVTLAEKRKARADYFLESKRYVLALQEYRNILADEEGLIPSFQGRLLHNMGVAQARMFLFEQAAASFGQAYRLTGEEECLLMYLSAQRFLLKEPDYLNFLTEHPEYYEASLRLEERMVARRAAWTDSRNESEIASMKSAFFAGEEETCARLMNEELDRLKEAYRDCVVQ